MFKIAQKDTYWWPVAFELPVDGGKREKMTFDAEFRRLPQPRLDALAADARSGAVEDAQLGIEILVGWRSVMDADSELPFSDAARDELFAIPGVRAAVIRTFFESISGARQKN